MFSTRFGACRGQGSESGHNRRHARGDFWPGGGRGFGGRHGGEHGQGRGGRMGRLFAHGDLHLVILHLVAEHPRHGYELIKAIEEMTGGSYTPSPGTVYPALTMLDEQGYLAVEASDGNKKLYSVTEDGKAYLQANQTTVTAMLARVGQAGEKRCEAPSPRIIRAVENLKLALHLRLSQAPLSEDQTQALVGILDRAAGEIERS